MFLISFNVKSQELRSYDDNTKDAEKLCKILGKSFVTETEAIESLDKILAVIGASRRFILKPCDNIDNAMAISLKGIRYIFYNQDFMKAINEKTGSYWSNMSILAHEIGHHINGHTIDAILYINELVEEETLAASRKMELEADEFAGFVLGKLGATLSEATKAISLVSSDDDDSYSTHPSKSKRIDAIKKGYNNALKNVVSYKNTTIKTAEEYFYSGYKKAEKKDYYSAINDYTNAIKIKPNFPQAYINRGISKENLGDINGACIDWKKAVSLGNNLAKKWILSQCK